MTHGPEYLVKKRVKETLKGRGAWFFMPMTGGFGKAGIPDFVGIYKGRGFGIECKAAGGRTTPLQDMQLAAIAVAGGFALVINETEGWEELIDFLKNG